ncbi:MAG TPA: flagellar hook-length control protein FliK [Capillimicrobium sp.]|nr:flagellar hook-length control protein FliK [Capillimicrobium sp.]
MTTTPITTAPPDPVGTGGTPRGGPPGAPGTSFEQVLGEQEQAWTASAGGQQEQPAGDTPGEAAETAPVDALMALLAPAAVPAAAVAPGAPAPGTAPGADGTATAPASHPAAVELTATPAQSSTTAPDGAATTLAAPGTPQPPLEIGATLADDSTTGSAAGAGTPPSASESPVETGATVATSSIVGAGAGGRTDGDGRRPGHDGPAHGGAAAGLPANGLAAAQAPSPETAPDGAGAAATTAASGEPAADSGATAAQSSTTAPGSAAATASTAPAAPRGDAAPLQPPAPVPAAHAPEALRDLIELARTRDAHHARLVLHPNDLGGVEVHLRQTADGVEATVQVDHPEALAVLQRGLGDLQRSLEARGVTLTSVDLGLAGEQQQSERRPEPGSDRAATRGALSGIGDGDEDAPETLSTTTATTTVRLSAGAVVDVMA